MKVFHIVAILHGNSLDDNLAGAWLVSSFVGARCRPGARLVWFGSLGASALSSRGGGVLATSCAIESDLHILVHMVDYIIMLSIFHVAAPAVCLFI